MLNDFHMINLKRCLGVWNRMVNIDHRELHGCSA